MNNRGIRFRVLVLALLPLILVASGLSWYFIQARYSEMDQALEDRALFMADQLGKASELGLFAGDVELLDRLARPMLRDGNVESVVIADPSGQALLTLGRPRLSTAWVPGTRVGLAQNGAFLRVTSAVQQSPHLVAADASLEGGKGQVMGYVALEVSRAQTRARQRAMLITGLAITATGLALAGLLAWRLGRDIVLPIDHLTKTIGRIGAGDLNARVQSAAGGEFALLEQGVNRMASELKSSYETLQEKIRAATTKLAWQANHDALTGLLNRFGFEEVLEQVLASSRAGDTRHCLMYIDLDQFKVVNDTSGHLAGDELLRQLAARMPQRLRASDVVARLGGDEFGVLLTHCDVATGERLGEKLRRLVEEHRFVWDGRIYQVGASIGLVEIDEHWIDTIQLMSAADAACYAAKDAGRNKVRLYRPGDEDVARRRGEMEWASRLTRAMEEERLLMYYQPIVALGGDDLPPHYELLLRLEDEGALILPMAFIPAAERYQLMPMLDRWVIEHALAQCTNLRAELGDGVLGINLSGASLSDAHFQSYIREKIRAHPALARHLCFEITETAAVSNLDTVLALIEDLKAFGCHFALDDFGSGLSSFGYLRSLTVDYLKIDGAFVLEMALDPVDAAMVEAIVKVAHIMGVKTVAEFVENEATAQALRQLGVDYAQGNHFAEPKPLSHLCQRLVPGPPDVSGIEKDSCERPEAGAL